VKFAAGEDAATLCTGLREAFDDFGGVPEHVLFDNMKAVVSGFSTRVQAT
jgi:transposase